MKLSKTWTTVTSLSKALAMILFITLPFIGFYVGYKFPHTNNLPVATTSKPVSSPDQAANWKTYKNNQYNFQFSYPQNYVITNSFDRSYNALTYNTDKPCLVSFGIQVSPNDLDPEGSFCLLNNFTSGAIGQSSGINFNREKNLWTAVLNGTPEQVLSFWDKTKNGVEIIKTTGDASEASSYYYFIPKSNTNNSLTAVFAIPEFYRLRCDLITQTKEQIKCNSFYTDIIQKFNKGEAMTDTSLPENYLKTLYKDSETMVKSFNFTN